MKIKLHLILWLAVFTLACSSSSHSPTPAVVSPATTQHVPSNLPGDLINTLSLLDFGNANVPASYASVVLKTDKQETIGFDFSAVSTPAGALFWFCVAHTQEIESPNNPSLADLSKFSCVAGNWPSGEDSFSYDPSALEVKQYTSFFVWEFSSQWAFTPTMTITVQSDTSGSDVIDLALKPSRTSGVAPLAIFFDASATIATTVSRPFHELEYVWDFGDPQSGTWLTTGRERNKARGPVAGHLFEKPGNYTVTLSARDQAGNSNLAQVEITVQNPDAIYSGNNTICISKAGNFAGAPAGSLHISTTDFDQAMSYVATGKRLLFRRGESWSKVDTWKNAPGPITIGAFGTGAKPAFQTSPDSTFLRLSGSDQNTHDWRVMDLAISGSGGIGIGLQGTVKSSTFFRLDIHDMYSGFTAPISVLDYYNNQGFPQDIHRDLAIVDSNIVNSQGWDIGFMDSENLMLAGNNFDTSIESHVVRIAYVNAGVISNNRIANAGLERHALKLHAGSFTSAGLTGGLYTEKVLISENIFDIVRSQWGVVPGPQNSEEDERLRDILIERNHFIAGNTTSILIRMSGEDTTLRNNIFDLTKGEGNAIWVSKRGSEPSPKNCHILNNTFYDASPGSFTAIHVASDATQTVARNNLASAPHASSAQVLENENSSTSASHNLLTNSPGWVTANPSAANDFQITSASPAIDTGIHAADNFGDFLKPTLPIDGDGDGIAKPDLGAFEYQ